jgi:hypothetical protein
LVAVQTIGNVINEQRGSTIDLKYFTDMGVFRKFYQDVGFGRR